MNAAPTAHPSYRATRAALDLAEAGIRQMKQHHRRVELPVEVSPLVQPNLLNWLTMRTFHLGISALECRARIGDGPNDPYYALIEMHVAVEDYAIDIFPHITFHRLAAEVAEDMPPERELDNILQIIERLLHDLMLISGIIES